MRFVIFVWLAGSAFAQQRPLCPRPAPGGLVHSPVDVRSQNGLLSTTFSLQTGTDVYGLTAYCYIDDHGAQSPTLRVNPGDEIVLKLKNELPLPHASAPAHHHSTPNNPAACASGPVTASSSNLHFHGLNLPPVCHQDDVLHTLVQPGDAPFEYRMKIPQTQPPGLYWYHPHPHGFSDPQVLGGASGAMIVEGIERAHPEVAGLPERVIVLRDRRIGGLPDEPEEAGEGDEAGRPTLDVSINQVPVLYPLYKPAVLAVPPEKREFWRVLNASADTFFDIQLLLWPNPDTQVPQPLQIVALDGAPVGHDFASAARTSILLPPGSRAEFIVTTPPAGSYTQFLTRRYSNGPLGNNGTYRVLATVRSLTDAPVAPALTPEDPNSPTASGFSTLTSAKPATQRKLYFSESSPDPKHPKSNVSYFLTVDGAMPKVFDMDFKTPDLKVTQGTVEDWTIENRAQESHVFHIHQLHFQLLERDGKPVNEAALRDTIELPYWDGKSSTYPSIKLRMDFRDPNIIGTFLYHCHILEHEDGGMMGAIEVVPPHASTKISTKR